MGNLKFVDLFQENKIHNISNNFSPKQRVIKADSIKTKSFRESENQSHAENIPEIKLKKKGNVVEFIVVTCSCGRETKIALEYDNGKNKNDNLDSGAK